MIRLQRTSLRNQLRTCAAVSSCRILSLLHRHQSPVLAPLRLPCSYAPPALHRAAKPLVVSSFEYPQGTFVRRSKQSLTYAKTEYKVQA